MRISTSIITTLLSLMAMLSGHVFMSAQSTSRLVKVAVVDSLTQQPLPFAAVTLPGTSGGQLADERGEARLFVGKGHKKVTAHTMGYKAKTAQIGPSDSEVTILLAPSGVELSEVTVKRKKEKYSKKNNPAVDFANAIKKAGPLTDPRRNDNYNYEKYERITMGINEFTAKKQDNWMFSKFNFLSDHVDTSEISGKPILTLAVREKVSDHYYRREPEAEREYVVGLKRAGVDDLVSNQENVSQVLSDVFREIDLYQNDITVLQSRFVSPLGRIAPDFYKFYLTDTVTLGGDTCVVLSFVPRNTSSSGFTGRVYVPMNDSTMFIRKVEMRTPTDINLNFIRGLHINQEFKKADDGSRLKTHDDLVTELEVLPGTPQIFVRRNTAYRNHNFNEPDRPELFNNAMSVTVAATAGLQNDEFWHDSRQIAISRNEERVDTLMTRLRHVPLYYWVERIAKVFASGYIHTGKPSKFDIGRIGDFVGHNGLEGWRFQLGGLTTAALNKHIFARGYGAYALKDKKWKYGGELEYSFIAKQYHSREFPIHSVKVSHLYDVDMIGQYATYYTNIDGLLAAFTRMADNRMTYHRVSSLDYQLELHNHFSVTASLSHMRQEATVPMPFVDGSGNVFNHYNQATGKLLLRWAPGEKFVQGKTDRRPINLDAPVFTLSHTVGPRGLMGARWTLNKTEATFNKRFWLSAFGHIDVSLRGAHVWSRVPYPALLTPNANISYTIQPESFSLLNPLEFLTDTYGVWDLTYWANGTIFNAIPYFKKLKLREVFTFRGFAGHLSVKNDPIHDARLLRFPESCHPQRLGHTPYMEAAVGLDNLFKIFRVDYVWRLTYRHNPYIDKSGIRASVHITF